MSSSKSAAAVEDVDDLDDILDDFNAPAPSSATDTAPPPTRSTPEPAGPGADPGVDEDFAKQLEASFAAMLGQLAQGGEDDRAPPSGNDEAAFIAQFEKLMRGEMGDLGGVPPSASAPARAKPSSGKGKAAASASGMSPSSTDPSANFQDAIRATMDKLKESDRDVSDGLESASNDPMAALMAALGGGSGDLPDDAELDGVLQGFMDELMSKEMLEEPLRQLDKAYPDFFAKYSGTLPADELARYRRQHEAVHSIVTIFSDPNYKADDPVMSKRVVEAMSRMEQEGAPPKECMGDLPEGMQWNADGMPQIPGAPEQCSIM